MTGQCEVDAAIRESFDLFATIVEVAGYRDDPMGYIRSKIEALQLELDFLAPSADGGGGVDG